MPSLHDIPPVTFERLIEEFGLKSPRKASNLVMTAKRMFGRSLQDVIGTYAHDTADIESEIRDLREIISHSKRGRR
jgi:hypothetical protein